MKEGKASRTAEGVAALRAAESLKSADERVCYDPLAVYFLPAKYKLLVKSRLLTKLVIALHERKGPGTFGCIVGRTRYIDECLKSCIDDGIEQLVILGAGYDTRGYRFDQLKDQAKVFEVDHPATQKVKIEKVKELFGNPPDHVVYVPVDFEKERLDERLFACGYDKNLKTLFIWEGVTMYLTAEAVDETLDFVTGNSGEGSSIVFNYVFQSVIDGNYISEDARKIHALHEKTAEPFKFGIEEGAIDKFLSTRGFTQLKDVTGEYFKDTYCKGNNRNRKVCSLCGFVHAAVKPREGS